MPTRGGKGREHLCFRSKELSKAMHMISNLSRSIWEAICGLLIEDFKLSSKSNHTKMQLLCLGSLTLKY